MKLQDNRTVVLVAAFVDGLGGGVEPVEPVVWASSDTDVVTLEATAEQAHVVAIPAIKLGHAKISATSGELVGTWDIEVVSGAPSQIVPLNEVPVDMTDAQLAKQAQQKANAPPPSDPAQAKATTKMSTASGSTKSS